MKAALKNLPEGELQKISLTHSQYQKAKHEEDEIQWQGEMYDVVKIKVGHDRIIIFALKDEAETDLLFFLTRLVDYASDDEQSTNALSQFFALVYTVPQSMFSLDAPAVSKQVFSFQIIHKYIPSSLEVMAPPPRA